jgi:hypothetical protein
LGRGLNGVGGNATDKVTRIPNTRTRTIQRLEAVEAVEESLMRSTRL